MADMLTPMRQWMRQTGIDVILFPHNDRFQSEYLPTHDDRLAWLSGFTGSAGFAIITADQALLFVNPIYSLQAPMQVDQSQWTVVEIMTQSPAQWLNAHLQPNQVVALEEWRFTINSVQPWQKIAARRKATLRQLDGDIADTLWSARPTPETQPAFRHDIRFAGKSSADKIADMQDFLAQQTLDGFLLTDPGHVCWLLNLRGRDVAHTPILLAMAFVAASGPVMLFTDPRKIDAELRASFDGTVAVYDFDKMETALIDHTAAAIGVDPSHAPSILAQHLKNGGKDIQHHASPVEMARAIKNETEIAGGYAAHRRDGVAVIDTLHWLDTHDDPASLTEMDVVAYLSDRHAAQDLFVEEGFATIAGAGPHGAIVHYHVTPDTNIPLQMDNLLLLDSGGQYRDGTTDITRTIAIGTPTAQMVADYTSVLQGYMALTTARFAAGTSGTALDTLARAPLWQYGRAYGHGTGHGIGSFMSVHEGPQRFSPIPTPALQPGMFMTIEPGYYKTDAYGIRLENVVVVIDVTRDGDEQAMLGFDVLTRAPFAGNLIDFTRLSENDKHWLRDYHQTVLDDVSPLLQTELQNWLREKCAPFLG